MAYAAQSDMETLYGARFVALLADRNGDGINDTVAIAAAFDRADYEIDSYLSQKYTLPLGEASPHLVQIAVDIAAYRLAPSSSMMTEDIEKRYNSACKWLTKVAEGKVGLGLADSVASHAAAGGPKIVAASPTRRMTRAKLSGLF